MCGITCIVALDQKHNRATSEVKNGISQRLNKGLELIRHRGPDSSGEWISDDGRVALGHVRLEINDLSPSGCQPLHSSDDKLHVVVNGELYDYSRLRVEMEEKINYQFQGTSDCELVLALYKCYGLDFLEYCRGEFSLCLYDVEKDLFLAVRDRYGIKPLFWTIQNDELWVAAEMKAFIPLGWQPEWDTNSIVNGDFHIGSQTIFKNVQKVRPGHYLKCHAYEPIEEHQYWDSTYPDKRVSETRSEQDMISGFHDHLLESIRLRLRADVKVGVSLSGGIDSSLVAGMTAHLLKQGHSLGSQAPSDYLSCFGIAFDNESGFDESDTANRTADFLGVKFYKKHMDEQALADMLEDATWHNEQPNPDLNFIGTYALSSLFREHGFRVNINGQGSDEIVGGYNIFQPDFLREPDLAYTPPNLTLPTDEQRIQQMHESEATLNTVYSNNLTHTNSTPKSTRAALNNNLTPHLISQAFPALPFHATFTLSPPTNHEQTYLSHLSPSIVHCINNKWHPLNTAHYIFTRSHLQNLLLSNLGDRGEMAHSIEGRTPFLDHALTEYTNNLPPSMKLRWTPTAITTTATPAAAPTEEAKSSALQAGAKGDGTPKGTYTEKFILRQAGRKYITDEVYKKKKHPYSAPVRYSKAGPLYGVMKKLVTEERVGRLGWLDAGAVERVVAGAFVDVDLNGIGDGDGIEGVEGKSKGDVALFRLAICLAQWVVLAERFGVKKAVRVVVGKDGEAEKRLREGGNLMLG